ncbi:MAG: HAMP domain-containing sensor histidine kinase [Candidatus Scalindua sp.]
METQFHIKRGIRKKLLYTMIGLIAGLLITLTFIHTFSQKRILERETESRIAMMKENLVERGRILSDYLSRQAENDIAFLNLSNVKEIINKSIDEDKGLSYAILVDQSSKAHIHTLNPELEGEKLSDEEDWFAVNQSKVIINEYVKDGNSFMEFVVPVNSMEVIVPVNANTEPWGIRSADTGPGGILRLGFSLNLLNKEITNSRKGIEKQTKNIIIRSILTSFMFISIGVTLVFMISTRLSKPIIDLTESARELSKGNFGITENIKIDSGDEIGVLASEFIEMSRNLKISREHLEVYSQTLEQKVEDRTIKLKEANEKSEAANKKLQEIANMKTEFLSTVSHELRTPLALVLGFARIIKKRFEDVIFPHVKTEDSKVLRSINQVGSNLDTIVSEGDRLTYLINDLLDITKIEAGKVEWKMEPTSVAEVIKRATAIASSSFEENTLELIKDVEDRLPKVVGDENRIQQVIINLISNAVKFTEKGSVTCRARKINNEIMVSVIDTGTGISESDYKKIFEKFKQTGTMLKNKPKGTGLGLPICKEIVEHHGGRIWVESEQGKGSVFSFTLPCSN